MLDLSLNHYLTVSAVLFALGIFGIFEPKERNHNSDVDRIDAFGG